MLGPDFRPFEINSKGDNMKIEFNLNGTDKTFQISGPERAIEFLREKAGIKSIKEGCGEGECGACTILLDGKTVCSCLLFASELNGKAVLTLEGLGNETNLHPIQKAFYEKGGVQCGFCTPGFILSTKALLDKTPNPSLEEIKKGLEGNLCRCTGYTKIIDSVQYAAELIKKNIDVI